MTQDDLKQGTFSLTITEFARVFEKSGLSPTKVFVVGLATYICYIHTTGAYAYTVVLIKELLVAYDTLIAILQPASF